MTKCGKVWKSVKQISKDSWIPEAIRTLGRTTSKKLSTTKTRETRGSNRHIRPNLLSPTFSLQPSFSNLLSLTFFLQPSFSNLLSLTLFLQPSVSKLQKHPKPFRNIQKHPNTYRNIQKHPNMFNNIKNYWD